jgi:hypothetical protein
MATKRRIRKFVVTIEIEEVTSDEAKPNQVTHQTIPPLQTRDGEELGWLEQQELRKRRRRRPANSE